MEIRQDRRSPIAAQKSAPATAAICGVVGILEIVVATAIVVGFFSAISQPFGWSAAAQIATCAVMGGLLWRADATLSDQNAEC